jgi:5-methylcytosine-specific restriction endonuclease McrA
MSRKDDVWQKAKPIRGQNPDVWRKDTYGNKIRYGSYGTQGEYGWELDHKNPKANGGTNNPRNIQPLYWEENRQKGDKYPY